MMTKDEVSDLKSHVDRITECELAAQRAKFALDDAKRNLEMFLHYQEHPKK